MSKKNINYIIQLNLKNMKNGAPWKNWCLFRPKRRCDCVGAGRASPLALTNLIGSSWNFDQQPHFLNKLKKNCWKCLTWDRTTNYFSQHHLRREQIPDLKRHHKAVASTATEGATHRISLALNLPLDGIANLTWSGDVTSSPGVVTPAGN